MARTKLAQGKMTEAAKLAEEVIGDANFSLADFDQIFRGKANREEIFSFVNLLNESSVNLSASLYSRASANGGSYTYAPTTKVMNMFEPMINEPPYQLICRKQMKSLINIPVER